MCYPPRLARQVSDAIYIADKGDPGVRYGVQVCVMHLIIRADCSSISASLRSPDYFSVLASCYANRGAALDSTNLREIS